MEIVKKNIPQPSNPLKSFNWSKIPDTKLTGTIWSELDDSKLYNTMELDYIDKLFCAYQKNGVAVRFTNSSVYPSLLLDNPVNLPTKI